MPTILDGKALADKICLELKDRVDKLKAAGKTLRLTIVTSGDDAASKVYVRNKVRRAEEIGIDVNIVHHNDMYFGDATEAYDWHPIIYQMPMTGDVSLQDLDMIIEEPRHDVDGFVSHINVALLAAGVKPHNYPCTPKGVFRLLAENMVRLDGQNVCILGRSNIVGRPLARMMEQVGATVTVCHRGTPPSIRYQCIGNAEVVVSATGCIDIINYDAAKYWGIDGTLKDKVFVDVGIVRGADGKLRGDIDPEIFKHCKAYTPVPGGVGPMTVAMLMENVIEYYEDIYSGV